MKVTVRGVRLFDVDVDEKFVSITANGRDHFVECRSRLERVRVGLRIARAGARLAMKALVS